MPVIPIKLPKLGESVADATILKWLVQPGDTIVKDQIIAEVATDKVDTDLFAEYDGIIKSIEVAEGARAMVGTSIATVEVNSEVHDDINELFNNQAFVSETKSSVERPSSGRKLAAETSLFLTPVVRNIAAQANLTPEDLKKIARSGGNQTRITKKDILNYLNPPKEERISNSKRRELKIEFSDEVVTLSRMRQLIAKHLSESVHTAAHVTTWVIANVSSVVEWRESVKLEFQEKHNSKLTYTHIFMHLVIQSLIQFPKLNAWYDGIDQLVIKKAINLGFAAATPDNNLIVPNIKSAQDLSLQEIVKQVSKLGADAKSNRLKTSDIEGTSFTVSNTGIFGSLMGTPLLTLPQVAILALGEIVSAPGIIVEDGIEKIAIVKQMHLSLSYDHRIIDGAYASRFLSDLKHRMADFRRLEDQYAI